jgi:hypothetical protein
LIICKKLICYINFDSPFLITLRNSEKLFLSAFRFSSKNKNIFYHFEFSNILEIK